MEVGEYFLVFYDGFLTWHERLVLHALARDSWASVLTPDGDVYLEQLSTANDDLAGVRKLPQRGANSFGVAAVDYYLFAVEPTAQRISEATDAMLYEATSYGPGGGLRWALVAPVGAAAAVVAAAVGVWVVAVPTVNHSVGEAVAAPAGANIVLDKGVVDIGGVATFVERLPAGTEANEWTDRQIDLMAKEVGDIRILPVSYDGDKRNKEFRIALKAWNENTALGVFRVGLVSVGVIWRQSTIAV